MKHLVCEAEQIASRLSRDYLHAIDPYRMLQGSELRVTSMQ
jgi:hypothetical protein